MITIVDNMSKCLICNKKIKLTELSISTCKCKKLFCNLHKTPEVHNCTYDYRLNKSNDIEKNNQKIISAKVQQI